MIPQLGLAALWLAAALCLVQLLPTRWLGTGDPRKAISLIQAALLAIATTAMLWAFLLADIRLRNVAELTNSSRSLWERAQDAGDDWSLALLCLLLGLALLGALRIGSHVAVSTKRRLIPQVLALPLFAMLLWQRTFGVAVNPPIVGSGFGTWITMPYFMPLLGIGAALVVAGWIVAGSSHRSGRLWGAAGLQALAAASVVGIAQTVGPWWPLIDRDWNVVDWFAIASWIGALALLFRVRQRRSYAGIAFVACGAATVAFVLGVAIADYTPWYRPSDMARLCLRETQSPDPSNVTLHELKPTVGKGYTGVQAKLTYRFGDGKMVEVRPEWQDYHIGAALTKVDSVRLLRWNGELGLQIRAEVDNSDCIDLRLEWHRFAQWLRYGAWLSLIGATILFLSALRSAWWRVNAGERIAMRRSDRGWPEVAAVPTRLAWQPLAIALSIVAVGLAGQLHAPPQGNGPLCFGTCGKGPSPSPDAKALTAARIAMNGGRLSSNRWVIIADAMMRNGQPVEAAEVLLGAVEKQPDNAEAWLVLGDALYAHSGVYWPAPAAELAYSNADRAAVRAGKKGSLVAETFEHSGREELTKRWLAKMRQMQQAAAR